MKKHLVRVAGLLTALALAPCLRAQSNFDYAHLERPDEVTFYSTPLGLCEDYPEERTTSEIIHDDMVLLRDTTLNRSAPVVPRPRSSYRLTAPPSRLLNSNRHERNQTRTD